MMANLERRSIVFSINPQDKNPLYQQIMDQMILFISNGLLEPGDRLPSIRELASQLGINPNTVVRAYSELESSHFIITYPKRGTFVQDNAKQIEKQVKTASEAILIEAIDRVLGLGLPIEKLKSIFEEVIQRVGN